MTPLAPLALLAILLAMGDTRRERELKRDPGERERAEAMQALIRRLSRSAGVPEPIALATAWVESGFNPDAEGDLQWHENEARFNRVVPKNNAFAWNRKLWHSYGLFQLLAPYHVHSSESPEVLLDPQLNAARGIAHLAKLMYKHGNDTDRVRLAYVGLPVDRIDSKALAVLDKWHKALAKFGYDDPHV